MFDVITIGSATRDNYLIRTYDLRDDNQAPSGKILVLNWGEKYGVDEVYSTIGGNAANASITFTRQGFNTACAAKIGSDVAGREFLSHIEREKVDRSLIRISSDGITSYSALLTDNETGERTILNHHGIADGFGLHDLNLEAMDADWWYISLAGESHNMYMPLISHAKEKGIKIAFNPSGDHIKHHPEDILASLPDVSFFVVNRGEAAALLGVSFVKENEIMRQLIEKAGGVVAITDGGTGVKVSDGKKKYTAGIFKEERIRDRTGAGDSFGSGFVAGLMHKKEEAKKNECNEENIRYAIRLASANATSVVEAVGSTENILTKEKFDTQLKWRDMRIVVEAMH
jgi:sugar/nucleoside kinase (ribokinase family)